MDASTETPMVSRGGVLETTMASSGSDVQVIITVAACIGGLFLVILIIFIMFVIYFYRKQIKEDEFDARRAVRGDKLDWKSHSLARQFGDVRDIDEMLWTDRGRKADDNTNNPAFGKDFQPLEVKNLRAFDSTDDDAATTPETESSSDLVAIILDDGDGAANPESPDGDPIDTKQISILDMKTWGQPGSSRRNSMRSLQGFAPPPSFAPRSPDANLNGANSIRSQSGKPFPPYANTRRHNSEGSSPFTVSQPSNDPRFEYTRTNPLMAEAVSRSAADRLPFFGHDEDHTSDVQRDFGGTDDIDSLEFDRSSTLRGSRRNQSVVDFYESGTRTSGSSLSLALEGSGASGKSLLWQNKKFGGMGFMNTT